MGSGSMSAFREAAELPDDDREDPMPKAIKFPKLPRPKRRSDTCPEDLLQRNVDYYVSTHSAAELARMLVELEWREGYELSEE